jgi:hypothetical protein
MYVSSGSHSSSYVRQLRGNLPQAFVHAGVLECAVTLSRDVRLGTAG